MKTNRSKLIFSSIILSLGMATTAARAGIQLNQPTFRNDLDGERLAVTITFPSAIRGGDLYVAFQVGSTVYFLANGGQQFSTTIAPFISNNNYSSDVPVLNIPSKGLPAGTYTVYQVTAVAGANLLNANNWFGGAGGLSSVSFSVAPAPQPPAAPQPDVAQGRSIYNFNCAPCHGGPWYGAQNAAGIRATILSNRGGMGYLNVLTDAQLEDIAAYARQ